jgi:glycosyltransferase involved in cell wall biosynthesis
LPVTLYPNATRADLARLYAEADCYWHGAGLGADPEKEPEKFEHFGITVVEAMASGCIPFVLDHGGPASIVTSGASGWTYRTIAELAEMTAFFLASMSGDAIGRMRSAARERARAFGAYMFSAAWIDLLNGRLDSPARKHSGT